MVYKVYVGSMSSELRDIRPIVVEQVKAAGMIPLGVEEEETGRSDVIDLAHQRLQESDCFITVLAYRRGWQPPGLGGKSLAEAEYEWAQEYGKATAVLMPDALGELSMYLRRKAIGQSRDESRAQKAFRTRVAYNVIYWFKDVADLSQHVTLILGEWAARAGIQSPVPAPAPAELAAEAQAVTALNDADVERIASRVAEKVLELNQLRQQDMAERALKYGEALRLLPGELVFGRPSKGSQFKADVFMIMPFAAEFDAVYRDVLAPAVGELNLTLKRGDDFSSALGSIIEEVWSALNACRFVIADITVLNANVYYELGLAHTLNKPAILITQATKPEQVPFDIRHIRYIQYENSITGGKNLAARLKDAITGLLQDLEEGWGPG